MCVGSRSGGMFLSRGGQREQRTSDAVYPPLPSRTTRACVFLDSHEVMARDL